MGLVLVPLLALLVGLSCFAGFPGNLDEKPKPLPKVDLTFGVKIPLRDGVKLHASIYKPQKLAKPRPAIVTITPYQADSYHEQAVFFADHNYVFVAVDSRGRGNSGGKFVPFVHEGKDGYDVVEWVAQQKWCNGNVGMWGGSYGGFNQWATLKENPPHLKTIVPVASAYPGIDFPAPGGIFQPYFMQWLTATTGNYVNRKLFEDEEYWIAKYRKQTLEHLPFRNLDRLVGNPSKHWHTWLKHRTPDAYWDALVPSKEDYARFKIPILTITGHYDSDQPGAMAYYLRHMKHGSEKGKKKHYVIMGPWDHAGTRKPKLQVGGVKFAKQSLLEMNLLHKAWYDWTMDDGFRPVVLFRPFIYYIGGREHWRHLNSLEDIPSRTRKYFLMSRGSAGDAFHSGTLVRGFPVKSPPDKYRYDPLDVRYAELEKEDVKNFLTDQRHELNLFGAGVVYHTQPFLEPVEITGYMKFVASMKLNVPDTDFLVFVSAILPDGRSIFLSKDQLRARYRESLRKEKLIKPGTINRYEFTGFTFISRQLPKGTRLRLVLRAPSTIYLERNYNSGGRVECETAKDARTAEVTVYHDEEHQSWLEVPEVPR